ncbi:MAG: STAS domain-containing protein [Gammaproteobacteria bacterium]|nr:STAS domain-containing protein [Gammaproteobacteria bacterium]
MSISVDVSGDKKQVRLKISGRFDFSLHNEFRKAYKDIGITGGEYIVDLGTTEYLDSSALGMLLLLKEHAESESSKVRIINSSGEILEILHIASFDKLFTLA